MALLPVPTVCVRIALMGTALALTLTSPAPSSSQAAEPAAREAAIVPETIKTWVRQLDDDRFAVRETAHHRLIAAGRPALESVGEAAVAGSLESTTRAVGILLHWADGEDDALSLGALERLATLTSRPAEAAMANERLADVREKAALATLVELGGRIEYDRMRPMLGPQSLQVTIGPRWTGGVEGLEHIMSVRHATTVSFYSSPISGDQALSTLTAATHLQRLEFFGTEVSADSLAKIAETLPHAIVDVRGGARLGIQGSEGVGGAGVAAVQPGTAAAKAGIMPGDVIRRIDGVEVNSFKELTEQIAKAKVGDSVVLTVDRPGAPGQPPTPLDLTVTFEPWNDQQPTNPEAGDPLGGPTPRMPTPVFLDRR